MHLIIKEKALYDVFFAVKNSYTQAASPNGIIGGRYPLILDLCARIKFERERARSGVITSQSTARAELEDAREFADNSKARKSKVRLIINPI